jgi:hypothetical protein
MKTLINTLAKNQYFVREQPGLTPSVLSYDILDPGTHEILFECREAETSMFSDNWHWTRFSTVMPFHLHLTAPGGERLVSLRRHPDFLQDKIGILSPDEMVWATFEDTQIEEGIVLEGFDEQEKPAWQVKKQDKTYTLLATAETLGSITKERSRTLKDLFTLADNFTVNLNPALPEDSPLRILVLAVAVCVELLD